MEIDRQFSEIIETLKATKQANLPAQHRMKVLERKLLIPTFSFYVLHITFRPFLEQLPAAYFAIINTIVLLFFFIFTVVFIINLATSFWRALSNSDQLKFGDPLINRAHVDQKQFIHPAISLEQYNKQSLENFCGWLDYRIKLESLWIALGLGLISMYPNIASALTSFLDEIASDKSLFFSNPIPTLTAIIPLETFILTAGILILLIKRFILTWFSYLHITKYAIKNGFYRKTKN